MLNSRQLKSTLTIKPADLRIRVTVREGAPLSMHTTASEKKSVPKKEAQSDVRGAVPLYLAYGSNSGTCKDFSQRVGMEAPSKGEFIQNLQTKCH
jgi:cytochrome P450/NADPH-cytochrome P450 reductase